MHDLLCTRDEQGFTLLELLASLALISIILAIVAGGVRYSLDAVERGEKKIQALERMRNAVNIVNSQIQSYVPLKVEQDGEDRYYFQGERNSMRFATNYALWSGKRGYVSVGYEVREDDNGRYGLMVSERALSTSVERKTVLFENLKAIHFEYFYKDATDSNATWIETWDDNLTLPEKVRLHIMYGGKAFSLIIPMRSKGSLSGTVRGNTGDTLWQNIKTVPQGF
jgi:general secretion pathway protein J